MLQTNLIFGIQKKIREGASAKKESGSDAGMIEESTLIEETTSSKAELILESSFASGIHGQVEKAKKVVQDQKVLITESFHMHKAAKKLNKDISYFNFLFENFVDPVFEDQYKELLESIFEDTINLYQEADVTPRLVSNALDTNELNENQIVDIYKNRLNETIKNEYTKPMLKGEISELYESEIRDLTKKLITEGSTIDMKQVQTYLPFEQTLYNFNKEILIPKHAESRFSLFIESNTEEYLSFVEESAEHMLQQLEKKIKLLTSMVSPNMFDKAVDAEGIDAPKMAGITITTDKNFNDDDIGGIEGGCGMGAVTSDPEAADEMEAEDEAEEMEDEGGDINDIEAGVRDETDLANDFTDYEDESKQDEIAELSPAQATDKNPEQPEATEIDGDMAMTGSELSPEGTAENDSDVDLQGQGNDNGVLGTSDETEDSSGLEVIETGDGDNDADDAIVVSKVEVTSDDNEDLEGSEDEVSDESDENEIGDEVDNTGEEGEEGEEEEKELEEK